MDYDYLIIGCGPCGIALTLMLLHQKKHICIIEKEKDVGGCWKTTWIDDLYFSEHSPKIIMNYNYFVQLLEILNINPKNEFKNIYGNYFETFKKFSLFLYNGLTFYEKFIFIKTFLQIKLNQLKDITVHDWLIMNNFSEKGYETIRMLSIAAADIPEKLLLHVFFNDINNDVFTIKQLKDPKKWLNHFKSKISYHPNIKLLLNHQVTSINHSNNKITNIEVLNLKDSISNNLYAKEYLFSIPLNPFLTILLNSHKYIQDNWMPIKDFKNYVEKSSYSGFGFQFHFDYIPQVNNNDWCWSCRNEWNIIYSQVNDYVINFSKNEKIKCVWSIVIVDLNAYNSYLKKTVHQCDFNEITTETIRLLENQCNCKINPIKITKYKGIQKINDKWIINDSSTVNALGKLHTSGKIINLHYINSINQGKITTMNTALTSAIEFCNSKNLNKLFYKKTSLNTFIIIFLIFIIIFIFV